MIVDVTTTIERPPDDVFSFVSDVRNEPQWHTDVLEVSLTDDAAIRAGSTFGVKIKPAMGLSEGTVTVSAYEPPHRVVFQGRFGPLDSTITHAVEPEGPGSRFTRRIELAPRGMMRLMRPVMGPMVRRANTGFVANLKRVLEAS